MKRTRIFAMAVVLAATSISAARAAIESPVHRTFNVQAGGTVFVDIDSGDVRVNASNSASVVTVDVVRRAKTSSRSAADDIFRKYELTFGQQGNDVQVRGRYEHQSSWFHWNDDLDVRFVVTVPARFNADVKTSGGDVKISDLGGAAHVRTSGGDVELGRIAGVVDVKTSGGDISLVSGHGATTLETSGGEIKVDNADAVLRAHSSGGAIEIRRAATDVRAHTSGGGIVIGDAGGVIDADTSGGSIRARISGQPRGESKLTTSGGGITLSVAQGVALDIDAHTSGGDVVAGFPVTIQGKQDESTLNAKLNGGGPRLVLRSSGGDIRLER